MCHTLVRLSFLGIVRHCLHNIITEITDCYGEYYRPPLGVCMGHSRTMANPIGPYFPGGPPPPANIQLYAERN